MLKKVLVSGAAATFALSGAGFAYAASSHADGGQTAGAHVAARTAVPTLTACDGGAQKRVYNRIKSSPFTFGETPASQNVPFAAVSVVGPLVGTDTLSIEFSAETQMGGSTAGENLLDWMGLEVYVDGVPIQPFTASGDVLAITGSNSYNSNAAQFCTKIKRGKHLIQVRTNLHDGGTNDTLTGWLDDYTLHVEQSD
jgi:hypothetical protein